ncbi:hypothetical protein [Ectobacillus ponti]|uniref:Uncharacterized protein n=1 Tax=Ectobacillus ponti TaxID=2961894 RepID=A0AA41XC14_9BACI|nr:hypothetical protein [Ectobacillus ponti]MCP8970908.1 hypothetical protein [Ectobacillus ponti]
MNKVLEQVIKHNGFFKAMKEELKLGEDRLNGILEQYGLKENTQRRVFCWKLKLLLEQLVYEGEASGNGELLDFLVKKWNRENTIQLQKDAFSIVLDQSVLEDDRQKHAFQAICAGDLNAYTVYSETSIELFSELFCRFIVYMTNDKLLRVHAVTMEDLFGKEKAYSVKHTLSKLDFMNRSRRFLRYNIESLTQHIPLQEAVFAKGMAAIVLPVLEKRQHEEGFAEAYRNVKSWLSQQDEKPVQETAETVAPKQEEAEPIATATEQEAASGNPADQIQQYAQTIITLSKQLDKQQEEAGKMAALEQENERLRYHLTRLEEEREELQYTKLLEVFEYIAGQRSRYLLSELYKGQDQVPMARNLFNSLQMGGIEPFTNTYEVGEEITMKREKVKQLFALQAPLTAGEEYVTIRIMQHGWAMNGRVLIYPLAEEVVKAEQQA